MRCIGRIPSDDSPNVVVQTLQIALGLLQLVLDGAERDDYIGTHFCRVCVYLGGGRCISLVNNKRDFKNTNFRDTQKFSLIFFIVLTLRVAVQFRERFSNPKLAHIGCN